MGEDEKIALVNVKPVNTGCGAPVSELYRQMSNQTPKVNFLYTIIRNFKSTNSKTAFLTFYT